MGAEAVDGAVVEAHGDHADTFSIRHDQIEREILDEEVRVVFQALLVERVEHRMPRAVRRGGSALDRRPLAHVLHMPAERPLVDRAVRVAAERHAGVLELVDRLRRLAHHVFDRVLVAEPIGALDGVIHVPRPVVGRIVAEARRDPALRRDGVAPGREDLGDAGGLQPRLGRAHRRAQARTARAHHHDIVGVVDNRIGFQPHQAAPEKAMRAMLRSPNTAPPTAARLSRTSTAKRLPGVWT